MLAYVNKIKIVEGELNDLEQKYESATLRKSHLKKIMQKLNPEYRVEGIDNISQICEKKINECSYDQSEITQQNISILEDLRPEDDENVSPHITENFKLKIANFSTENQQLKKQITLKETETSELKMRLTRIKLENNEKMNEINKQKKIIERLSKAREVA